MDESRTCYTESCESERERGEWKSWLKIQHSEKEDHGIHSHHFMVSIPITSWQINGETVADCIIGGSQITADGDCNHEIKRGLVLGRKILTNLSSVQFTHSVVSNSLQPHGLQHARLPCPSPPPRACSNLCPLGQWYHPTISSWHPLLLLPSIFPSIRVFSN